MTERSNKMATDGVPTISKLLAVQEERSADGIAIVAPGSSPLTYSRLRSHLDAVGTTLARLGIARNHRVTVALPNGPENGGGVCQHCRFCHVRAAKSLLPFDEFDFYLSDLEASALIVQTGIRSPAIAAAHKHSIPIVELAPAPKVWNMPSW